MRTKRLGSKGEQTRLKIINAAIKCLGTFGEKETTFQKIAEICDVSQPLVVHYFKTKDAIFPEVVKALLNATLEDTENALLAAKTPTQKISAYYKISWEFFERQPELGRIYVLLYYRAAYDPESRALNSRLKSEATARLEAMISEGVKTKEFQCKNPALTAKSFHNSLTGLILNLLTEDRLIEPSELLKELTARSLDALSKR